MRRSCDVADSFACETEDGSLTDLPIVTERFIAGEAVVIWTGAPRLLQVEVHYLVEAKSGMSKMPQHMINVPLEGKGDPMESESVKAAVAAAEEKLNGRGRVLLRPSGTEPLIRVMVEADDIDLVHSLSEQIAESVQWMEKQ